MFTRIRDFRVRSFAINCRNCDRLILSLLFNSPKCASQNVDFRDQSVRLFANDAAQYDWDYIVTKMRQEGVAEAIFHNLRKNHTEHLVPPATYTALSDQYYTNLRRNLSVICKLKGILLLLKESEIPCIVLKGIALAEHIYPGIAIRGMSDIDILVKKSDLYAVDELLSSQGYTARDSSVSSAINNPEGYLASLEYRKENGSLLNLHIHWHIVNSSVPATMFVKHVDIERIWEKAVAARVADADVYILCPEHLIIYLCEHALRIGHSFDRLILITDIFYALKAYEKDIDWNFLVEESRRFNLDKLVYFSLSVVNSYASSNIPEECLGRLKPPYISLGERFFQRLQFNNRRIRGSSYFIYLAMNRTFSDKMKFLFRTFFPPRQILLQRLCIRDGVTITSHYTARVREVLSHIFSFFPIPEKMLKKP
ncbi:MAG: nucleotidyltransferase family protein [Syntrophales bacterium]